MVDIKIDFGKKLGLIKALHGVNNGPVCLGSLVDVSGYYKELGVPYVRVHDTNWPNPREVDIYTIFPDSGKDPLDPESYDFRRTDDYIKSIIDTGAKVVYRLGVSIEHTKRKYYTHPPVDFEKWADICVGIIKHYNDGWANGFHYDIQYWEIWIEPDNPDGDCMWSGTPEQYFKLYQTTATAIKLFDPKLKVGGFAATMVNPEFTENFLDYCKKQKAPIDFFSWHTYADKPLTVVSNAEKVNKLLTKYGYISTESHFNEWNYVSSDPEIKAVFRAGNEYYTQEYFERSKSVEGASFDAAVLILLQDCPVDVANYYDAAPSSFWSLFNVYGVPQKNYYAFKAFKMLYDCPQRISVEISSEINGLYCCCGTDDKRMEAAVLISNFHAESREYTMDFDNLPLACTYSCKTYLLDKERNLEFVNSEEISRNCSRIVKSIGGHSVLLLKISPVL